MKSLCLVAVLAAFGVAQSASADNTTDLKPFSLRLELPSDSVNCNARASSLGDVFAAQTGLTVTSANCQGTHSIVEDGNTFTTVTLVISYTADAEAVPSQAIFGGSEFLGQPSDHSGLFAKYGDCLSARGAQEAAFAANTGLQVFASYCDASNDNTNPGYTLVVEAFGEPNAHLYSFAQDPEPSGISPQITKAAKSSITQAGGTIALSDAAHIFYYAPSTIDVDVRYLGFFSDISQCQAQTATANAIFTQGKAVGVSAFCDTVSRASDVTLTVVAAEATNVDDDYGYSSPQYSSFSDCMGDLNRVIQNAQSNNENVLGGICEPSDSNPSVFVVDIYSAME